MWVQKKMCCGTRAEINNSGEDLKVVEYLGGKVVYERCSCRQNLAVSFVNLGQVGIEHRHKVQLEELCCEFRQKPESLMIL
jgi:hypothetical protein